jgi:hypothetical protein
MMINWRMGKRLLLRLIMVIVLVLVINKKRRIEMLPNRPMGGMEGPQVPVGPRPEAGMNDQVPPDQIKQQLVALVTQAKKIADDNGVNFNEVLSEVEGNKVRSDRPLPRPPAPSMP